MIRWREALRPDVPAIVALLADDELGAARETEDLSVYFAAFDAMSYEYGNSLIVGVGHIAKPVAEYLRISWRRRRGGWRGRGRSDLAQCVHAEGIVLGFGVAFAFLCNNMQKLRPAQGFNVAQDLDQFFGVVSVDQANVIKTNLLE